MIKGSVIQFLLSQVRTSTEALIGGKVYFYQPGTTSTTGIKIWLDEEATSAANNPYTLDADATAQIYASGKYRIVIKDALGVTQFDRDNVSFFDFLTPYEYDALLYSPNTFTQASITAALTAIGTTNKSTLLLRPGTWVISSNVDWSAYTNVTFKIVPGAVMSGAFTVNIPNVEAGLYQIFDSTLGVVTLSGGVNEVYPEWWGAKPDGTTDCSAAINSAISSNAVGNRVKLSNGTYLIKTIVNVNKKTNIVGNGYSESEVVTGATVIKKSATFTGTGILVSSAYASILEKFVLDGEAGNTGDGIVIDAGRVSLLEISAFNQGQDGIRIGRDSVGGNSNVWRMNQVFSRKNGRYGVNIDSAGTYGANANAGLATTLSCANNAVDGLYINGGAANTFVNLHLETNGVNGLHLASLSNGNIFFGGDFEGNSSKNILIDTTILGSNTFIAPNVDWAGTVTDNDPNTTVIQYAKQQILGSEIKIKNAVTGTGADILSSDFGDVPMLGELYVVEIGTNKYMNATFYKQGTAQVPGYTALLHQDITVQAVSAAGTVTVTGYTDTNNVRMKAIKHRIY